MSTPTVDIRLLLDTQLCEHPLETAFQGAVVKVILPEGRGQLPLLDTLKSLFVSSSSEVGVAHLTCLTNYLSSQTNHQRIARLTSVLHSLASAGLVSTKVLCEQLLSQLDLKNELVWTEGLSLISQIIGGVDYKGCRDVMNILLERYDRLPRSLPEEQLAALLKGQELLTRILNRDSSLLPAYFAADAIQRHYQPLKEKGGPSQPHWVLQPAVGGLQEAMGTLADLVSGSVQPHLRPILGLTNMSISGWKLDPETHGCSLKGLLPYKKAFREAQGDLLFHVLAQQNSKDAIHAVLGVNRTQPTPSALVEESLVSLGLLAMELSEVSVGDEEGRVFEAWSHFASQLVYCHFLQLITITTLLEKLRSKLAHKRVRKGRDWLMWSLLHFSSTVQSKADQSHTMIQNEFVPIMNLLTLLYNDSTPLPVPDPLSRECVYRCAGACVWVVYSNKAASEGVDLPCSQPHLLSTQIQWIQGQVESPPGPELVSSNYTVPLLLNIYSNNIEVSSKLLDVLLTSMLPSGDREATPISLWALNTLAMHAKIRLMEMIKVHLIKVVKAFKQVPPPTDTPTISAALLETYSRLLVWLGTRNFQAHLIPAVFESQAWGILHALLEIIVFRVHLQLQYSYRFQLLQQLHTVASVSIIPPQLHCSTENAALKLIQGLNSPEFLIQLVKAQFALDPKPLLSVDSEELNRVFVRVVAQSLATSSTDPANWLDQFMRTVLTTAPNCWSQSTLEHFPPALRVFCSTPSPPDGALVAKVEEESRRFFGLSSEAEQIRVFMETDSAAYFICVLWKGLMERGTVNPALVKVAQRTQPKKLAAFTRKLIDYIIFSMPQPATAEHITKVASHLLELVWQHHLFTVDRLALCMLLRGYEPELEVVCVSIVCDVLLASEELHNRLKNLVESVPSDYWRCQDWGQKHSAYNAAHPESFQCETPGPQTSSLPMHFGNLCLRLLPVLDLLIQRLLEVTSAADKYLVRLLECFKDLYKYHDQPLTFLYFTLHHYSAVFAGHHEWKLLLTYSIVGSQHDAHSLDWYFTGPLTQLLQGGGQWSPSSDYFHSLVTRLMKGLKPFNIFGPVAEWHFTEFASPMTFALYTALVELMCVPLPGTETVRHLITTAYDKAAEGVSEIELMSWINTVTLVMVSLPECFHGSLYQEIVGALSLTDTPLQDTPLLAVVHAYWHHANLGLLLPLPKWLGSVLGPLVTTETRLLFTCRLLGPLLNRLTAEKPKLLLEVVLEIYKMLQRVDKEQAGHMTHSDLLCDYLYHIKYMHIGDWAEIETITNSLHTPLKWRLRFMHSEKTA
ncbi:mediator of RNA polymerase II transcription subunit 23-like [Halichondria panicea]|uniref:mediator of RNA polymerase II transcription subunit 23-like n=1 Tax=Halichondria panicea TaxID=6063 RepID=UPI00312BC389